MSKTNKIAIWLGVATFCLFAASWACRMTVIELISAEQAQGCERPLLACVSNNTPESLRCETWRRYALCLEEGSCR